MLFGAWEMLLVAVVALLVLGPDKLPEVMRKMARALSMVRRVTDEVRQNLEDAWQEPAPVSRPSLKEHAQRHETEAATPPSEEKDEPNKAPEQSSGEKVQPDR